MIKLCIIDDDPRLASQIKNALIDGPAIKWIKTFTSGLGYVESLSKQSLEEIPDCILMDVSMNFPDEGIRAAAILHEKYPQVKVIMFTISDDDDRVFEAFKAGAVGYLLKNENPEFILKAIEEVVKGGALLSPSIALKTIKFLSGTPERKPESIPNPSRLTPREIEILRLISKGLKYQQIADQLFISDQTVKKHIFNIFEKLQVSNKIEALNKSRELL
jgi:DNA-binding NarL/FixJ family response regulator